MRAFEGETGKMRVNNHLWWNGQWLQTGWDIYWDGWSADDPIQIGSVAGQPGGPDKPVGPKPPGGSKEKAKEMGYKQIGPSEVSTEKVSLDELPDESKVKQESEENAIRLNVPIWVKHVDDEYTEPPSEL